MCHTAIQIFNVCRMEIEFCDYITFAAATTAAIFFFLLHEFNYFIYNFVYIRKENEMIHVTRAFRFYFVVGGFSVILISTWGNIMWKIKMEHNIHIISVRGSCVKRCYKCGRFVLIEMS